MPSGRGHRVCRPLASTALLASALLAGGCPDERSRALDRRATETAGAYDYRAILQRVRDRGASERIRAELEAAIRQFHQDLGRLPTNLAELVKYRYILEIPKPSAGHAFQYDPLHGNISVVSTTGVEDIQLPAEIENQVRRIEIHRPPELPPPE